MFTSALQARGQAEYVVFPMTCKHLDRYHPGLAFRQRTGFIDHKRIDFFEQFQRFSIAD